MFYPLFAYLISMIPLDQGTALSTLINMVNSGDKNGTIGLTVFTISTKTYHYQE